MTVTVAMPYYDNPSMLRLHLETWAGFPAELRDQLRFILVDDASPNSPAEPVIRAAKFDGDIRLYRISEDIPWRWDGARNLAADQMPDGPMLITDMDHLLDRKNASRLLAMEVRPDTHYVPARVNADGSAKPAHPNSWIMQRSLYWEIGGYDERFSSYYGKDAVFRKRAMAVSRRVELKDLKLILYGRHVVPDASTTSFGRKDSDYYSAHHPEVRAVMKTAHLKRPELTLNFAWERLI